MSNHQGARSQQIIFDGLVAALHPHTVMSLASDCQVGTTLVFHVGDILACDDVQSKKRPAWNGDEPRWHSDPFPCLTPIFWLEQHGATLFFLFERKKQISKRVGKLVSEMFRAW